MCDDNLLDVLITGGDLNTVNSPSSDNLSSINESANPPTNYEISSKNPANSSNKKNGKE